jgi:monoamine oxidase
MLVFFLNSENAKQIAGWTDAQIEADLLSTLSSYVAQPLAITNIMVTDWINDPYTHGSFSYAKVGTTANDFQTLKNVINSGNNNIWLIGEHTNPTDYSFTNGAYDSGEEAASAAIAVGL